MIVVLVKSEPDQDEEDINAYHGAAAHGEKRVESYASMQDRHKAFVFTMDSAANGNIAPWTDSLERLRDNNGYSSVVEIFGGKTPITHVRYMLQLDRYCKPNKKLR